MNIINLFKYIKLNKEYLKNELKIQLFIHLKCFDFIWREKLFHLCCNIKPGNGKNGQKYHKYIFCY